MFASSNIVLSLFGLALVATAAPAPILGSVTGLVGGLTGTVSSLVGSVPAQLQATCSTDWQRCNVTVSGEIENILTDGSSFTGKASVAAWMQNGHAYGSLASAGAAPLPLIIKCDAVADVCTGTVYGNVTQVFANGKQISLWGWLTPEGHCSGGVCVGSITGTGDPAYKKER